jgi:hypothetical protein
MIGLAGFCSPTLLISCYKINSSIPPFMFCTNWFASSHCCVNFDFSPTKSLSKTSALTRELPICIALHSTFPKVEVRNDKALGPPKSLRTNLGMGTFASGKQKHFFSIKLDEGQSRSDREKSNLFARNVTSCRELEILRLSASIILQVLLSHNCVTCRLGPGIAHTVRYPLTLF